jgi:hypothetical protein
VRRLLSILAAAAITATAATAGTADASAPAQAAYSYGQVSQGAKLVLRNGQVLPGFTGGALAATDGETVTVYTEDTLLAGDSTLNQHWADTLTSLLHGTEIADVTLYVSTLARVQQVCGSGALGCYDPSSHTIIGLGEDIRGIAPQAVVTHEYGHHLANSRNNDPWPAVDWGTKRWASYENVCRRSKTGELVPGDEGEFYQQNPGELFAEDYRVLNERRLGLAETVWGVVDSSLYPSQGALDALAQDVASPWAGNTTTAYSGLMTPRASGRGFRLTTPNDGTFTTTLTAPANSRLTLRVVDLDTGSVLASVAGAQRVKTARLTVCGERALQVQVKRVAGFGLFTLSVSKA